MSTPKRWLLFGAAIALGALAGKTVDIEPQDWAYNGLLRLIGNPGTQIPGLAAGVGVGFMLGLIHITSICYLPAALAAMPLVQAARNKREWFETVAMLGLGSVLVSALFGLLIGAPMGLLAGTVGSRRAMSLLMQAVLVPAGILMMVVALGELGLIRRLLPRLHFAGAAAEREAIGMARGLHRRAALLNASHK